MTDEPIEATEPPADLPPFIEVPFDTDEQREYILRKINLPPVDLNVVIGGPSKPIEPRE